MRLFRGEGRVLRRVVVVMVLAIVMFVVGGETVASQSNQFLLCSGPGETKRADGTAAIAGDYIIVVNSRNFEAILDSNDQVPEDTVTEENVTSSGGSYVRDDLSWGMYIPAGYVYEEAGTATCVINLKVMMREKGQDYFKEAVVEFDPLPPCQGRLWLNTSRPTGTPAEVCPQGAPATTSSTDTVGNEGTNSGDTTQTVNPVSPSEPEDNVEVDDTEEDEPDNNEGGSVSGGGNGGGSGGGNGSGNGGGNGGGSGGGTGSGNDGGNIDETDPDDVDSGEQSGSSNDQSNDQQPGTDDKTKSGETSDDDPKDDGKDSDSGDLLEASDEDSETSDVDEGDDLLEDDDASDSSGEASAPSAESSQQTVRPDAPRTGTGGIAAQSGNSYWLVLIGVASVLTAVVGVLIVNRRFVRSAQHAVGRAFTGKRRDHEDSLR